MRSRFARLGVLTASLVGLLASLTPAAEATTVATVDFALSAKVGTDDANDSIAYPCFGGLPGANGVPSTELTLCTLLDSNNPVSTKPKKGAKSSADVTVNLNINHNTLTPVAIDVTTACVAAGITVGKLTKSPVEAGDCVIVAAGTVAGHCGLSTGQVMGSLAGGVIGNVQDYDFDVKFTGVGGLLVINGSITKVGGGSGWVLGAAIAVPATGSCTNKHQLRFQVVGTVVALIRTLP